MPMPFSVQQPATAASSQYTSAAARPELESPRAVYPFPRMNSNQSGSRSTVNIPSAAGAGESSQSMVHRRNNLSTVSLASRYSLSANKATALEVYNLVYGNVPGVTPIETVERLYEVNAVYENPLVTASSRQVIADINALTRQLAQLDVPRPLAMFKTLFRPHSTDEAREPWFQALRVWSDIEDICDSDSFDGHHTSIIEHTLNILILPGLHSASRGTDPYVQFGFDASTPSLAAPSTSYRESGPYYYPQPPPPASLALPIPGLRGIPLPSPLHLKLHVLTRLSFNETGRITRHRDVWDVRDVLGLVPGMQVAQWIGTRVTARGLSLAARVAGWVLGRGAKAQDNADAERGEIVLSDTVSNSSSRGDLHQSADVSVNALGLHLDEEGHSADSVSTRTSRPSRTSGGGARGWGSGLYVAPQKRSSGGGGGGGDRAPDVDRDEDGT